jgi:hypothetical protein
LAVWFAVKQDQPVMNRLRHLARKKLFHQKFIEQNASGLNHACAIPLGFVCLVSLAALSGCGALKIRPEAKVDLTQTPVASVEASLPKGPAIAPGKKSPLVVKLTKTDGTVLTTEGEGKGKVQWKDLAVKALVVDVNNKGVVSVPKDPRVSDGRTGLVTVSVPSHPEVRPAELGIAFRYDLRFTVNLSGADGMKGSDGLNGMDGTSGTFGSMDPSHPSPGGNGSDGRDGSDGGSGQAGNDAPPVQVLITMHPGSALLLEASVSPASRLPVILAGRQQFFLIDPHGGSLTVTADGGSGGRGGKGGRGGHGGSGGIGTPNGSSGRDGLDGHDGLAGADGRGGLITVTYDSAAKPYLSVIHLSSQNGPSPVFREAQVAPLW